MVAIAVCKRIRAMILVFTDIALVAFQRLRVWLTGSGNHPIPLKQIRGTLHCWSEVNIHRVYEAFANLEPTDVVDILETGDLPRLDAPTVRLTGETLRTLLDAEEEEGEEDEESDEEEAGLYFGRETFASCTSVVAELCTGTGERPIASVIDALPNINCIRIQVASVDDAKLGCDLMRKPPPFLKGLEFVCASDPSASIPIECWSILFDFLCSKSVQIPD